MLKFLYKIRQRKPPQNAWAPISANRHYPLFEPKPGWESMDLNAGITSNNMAAPRRRRRIVVGIIASLLATIAALSGYSWHYLNELGIFDNHTLIRKITEYQSPDNTLVFDRDGEKIGEFFERYQVYVSYDQLPRTLIQAIVAIEDHNFFRHNGVDYKAILRAALVHLRGKPYSQGASTISQQLVRQFLLTREKTIDRKLREASLAMELERQLSKEKILELYLNNLFLGNGAYGVGAAAHRYFGKDLSQLGTAELTLIAGLFQSPSNYNPQRYPSRAKARQKQVIQAMVRNGFLKPSDAATVLSKKLVYGSYKPANLLTAPYFVDHVKDQAQKILGIDDIDGKGLRIYTTLDSKLQSAAARATQKAEANLVRLEDLNHARALGNQELPKIEAALLAIDPRSGDILAMLGGRDYNKSQFNRTTQSLRSPGSAFKPILYALALASGWKWSDLMYVDPVRVQNYRPRNAGNDYLSETTLLRAFYKSLNTPTVELGEKLGIKNVIGFAKKLGVNSPLKDETGTVLGASDVTMLDLARAYGAFANQGRAVETTAITKIADKAGKVVYEHERAADAATQVISPQIAYLTTQGMRSVLDHGTGIRSAELAEFAAGKTGTSNNSQDNWFCGYTSNLVAIAWVGSDNQVPIDGRAAGNTLALPIWDEFIKQSTSVRQAEAFDQPEGIVTMRIHPQYGHQDDVNGIDMYFLENNAPSKRYSALQKLRQSGGNYRRIFSN